jgi:alpha-tubulin suppressor-like RCC1 family protein
MEHIVSNNKKIINISAGDLHTIFLDADGIVYGCGRNMYGELGNTLNNKVNYSAANIKPTPIVIPNNKKIIKISAGGWPIFISENGIIYDFRGYGHTILLDSDGIVYSFGFNFYGQLGISTNSGNYNANPTPKQIAIPNNKKIMQISAGGFHTILLDTDGIVYGFGNNKYGQLGNTTNNGNDNANHTLTQIAIPNNKKIINIYAGGYQTILLDTDGIVYGFGWNKYGQLGNTTNNGNDNANPTLTQIAIPNNKKIIQISTSFHTIFLDTDGIVYGCGWNKYGQLGNTTNNGNDNAKPVLTQIAIPNSKKITKISAGGKHTILLDSDGIVYGFGWNAYGQLGNTTNNGYGNENANPTVTQIAIPDNKKITDIYAGGDHTILLSNYESSTYNIETIMEGL